MKTEKLFKYKPSKEQQAADGSYVVLITSSELSYFSPSGRARLRAVTNYTVYRIDFDGEDEVADCVPLGRFTRKTDALKEFKGALSRAKEFTQSIAS